MSLGGDFIECIIKHPKAVRPAGVLGQGLKITGAFALFQYSLYFIENLYTLRDSA